MMSEKYWVGFFIGMIFIFIAFGLGQYVGSVEANNYVVSKNLWQCCKNITGVWHGVISTGNYTECRMYCHVVTVEDDQK